MPPFTGTLDSFALRVEITASPYSYRVIEKSTGEVLLAQDNTAITFGGELYPVTEATNVMITDARYLNADLNLQLQGRDPLPPGAPHIAHLTMTFVNPEQLQIAISFNGQPLGTPGGVGGTPTQISEEFADQGEHYYGVWEYPFGGNLDDRGADHDFLGLGNERYVRHSSVRAPFYLTSRKYGIYVESLEQGHFSIAQAGKTSFSFRTPQLTYDIFYGPTYADIFRRYNAIAGPPVLPPTWAFGSIWWRDDEHDDLRRAANAQEKVLDDADHLRDLHIPAAAIWLDRPYGSGPDGWGSFDFDAGFPDPRKLIHDVNDRGMNLLLWISDSATGTLAKEGSARNFLFPLAGDARTAADVRRIEVYDWFKNLLDNYAGLGIKGYKIDRGDEGEIPDAAQNEIAALFPKMAAESLEARDGQDYFEFARDANDTARRYSAVWNGDTWSSFTGLQMAVKNALRAGAIDFPIWGSDTGGYFLPAPKELEARWLEFSAYSPLMEVIIGPQRTIWDDYDGELVSIARDSATTHADLIPYVRSYVYAARASGLPVMRALVFAYPNDPQLTDLADEYLYGENMLVAPVLEDGARSRKVYLPGAPISATPPVPQAAVSPVRAELASARPRLASTSPGRTPRPPQTQMLHVGFSPTAPPVKPKISSRQLSPSPVGAELASARPRLASTRASRTPTPPHTSVFHAAAPTAELEKGTGATRWLLANSDLHTVYRGGTTVTVPAPLNAIPVFIREGAIIPRGNIVKLNDNWSSPPPLPGSARQPASINAPARLPHTPVLYVGLSPSAPPAKSKISNPQLPPSLVGAELASARPSLVHALPPWRARPQLSPMLPHKQLLNVGFSPSAPSQSATPVATPPTGWAPTLHIEIYPGRAPSAFSYYTGAVAATITAAPAQPDNNSSAPGFQIAFGDLDATGILEVFCRATATSLSITRNGVPLVRGRDFQYDLKSQKLTIPFDSPATLIIHGATTLFN